MWELICDHRYGWGTIAADRSPWRSDGHASSVSALPGEAGLRFSIPQSRVVIPRKDADPWGVMRAVRAEIVVSRPPGAGHGAGGGGGTLIDADQSFRIRFDGFNEIIIEMLGLQSSFRLEGLPAGAWASISFWHNGVNLLGYGYSYSYGSGSTSGEGGGGGTPFLVPGQVPPVGPRGVWIGNRIGVPAGFLNGNIQSVRIWRQDPKSMLKIFLQRPFDPLLLDCWSTYIRKLNEVATRNPECAQWMGGSISQIHNDLFQKLAQKTPEKVAEFWAFGAAYQELWAAGKVGSAEMKELITRLRDWLKHENLFDPDDPDLKGNLENPCLRKIVEAVGTLDCDADMAQMIKWILGYP
ncbi:hypothetical protein JQ599_32070 [Bradyrhizobium diazoefficiens]|nr:hypothetical protein [Bradyrhizobium diazoefficiens]MBR0704579.1 hypothetical protein [Bradyrhizobium diazoefficiens]MBR0773147.1 hypothetical protein [Bradyrhizobium diazoefficiens]